MNYRQILACVLFTVCGFGPAIGQIYSGTGGNINTQGAVTIFPLPVTGLNVPVLNSTHGLLSVCIDIVHPWDDDLVIALEAPDGTIVTLSDQNGGNGDNYTNTCFTDSGATNITQGSPPFTGTFSPEGLLLDINNGQNGNGNWVLRITDVYPTSDDGNLVGWTLNFGPNPPLPPRDSSLLPIVIIQTNGQSIVDDPKIAADMGIIFNGPGQINYLDDSLNNYDGKIGIEIRGRSSQNFDKKSFGFETWDSLNNDIDVSLIGLPAEEDWILHGPFSDKSLIRNALLMELARQAGQYASRTRHVELYINGNYRGVYVLMEKIKRDNDRVDIAKLDSSDIAGDDLTGGYIFQVNRDASEGWVSNYSVFGNPGERLAFNQIYPKYDNILPVQAAYIAAYVDSFESALTAPSYYNSAGFRYDEYIDLHSFAVHFLLSEFAKNVDAYRLSSYMYKDKRSKGGKLHAGPMWDFNLAFYNADYCSATNVSGWMYDLHCDNHNPFWYNRMLQDSAFVNELNCTWNDLRQNALSPTNLNSIIDSMATMLAVPQVRNFQRWQNMGVYVWPNPAPIPQSYAEEILRIKDWLTNRGTWMDNALQVTCLVATEEGQSEWMQSSISPNPNQGHFRLNLICQGLTELEWRLYDMMGRTVKRGNEILPTGNQSVEIGMEGQGGGLYLLEVVTNGYAQTHRILLEK